MIFATLPNTVPTGKVDASPEHTAYVGMSLVKSLLSNGLKIILLL